MDGRRTYLDSLNADRVRRPQTTLEQLNRSLEQLERQLQAREGRTDNYRQTRRRLAGDASYYRDDIEGSGAARYAPRAATERYREPAYVRQNPDQGRLSEEIAALREEMRQQLAASRRELADRDLEQRRRTEAQPQAAAKIASEMEALRNELRAQLSEARNEIASRDSSRTANHASSSDIAGMRAEIERLTGGSSSDLAAIRAEIERLTGAVHEISQRGEERPLNGLRLEMEQARSEIERLTDAMQQMNQQRGDERPFNVLRLELEQARSAIDALAKDETIRSMGERWDDFERRMASFQDKMTLETISRKDDGALDRFAERLEQMNAALNGLPESLPLRGLDDKMKTLSMAVERFVNQNEARQPLMFRQFEERLDEISRAIVASAVSASSAAPDTEQLKRIESRIAGLARQIEESAQEAPFGETFDRLDHINRKVDTIATKLDQPLKSTFDEREFLSAIDDRLGDIARRVTDRLDQPVQSTFDESGIISAIDDRIGDLARRVSERLDRPLQSTFDDTAIINAFDDRIGDLARRVSERFDQQSQPGFDGSAIVEKIDHRLNDIARRVEERLEKPVAKSGKAAFEDGDLLTAIDDRLGDIARRIEHSRESIMESRPMVTDQAILGLEERLDKIYASLDRPAPTVSAAQGLDPATIGNIEAQIASLSRLVAREDQPDQLAELNPRLERLEATILGHRDTMVETAREAAERAIRTMAITSGGDYEAVSGLAGDLKQLESLTRRSDERNTKTFDAIHETLLKIVDRLGSLEAGGPVSGVRKAVKAEAAPSIDAAQALDAPEFAEPNFGDDDVVVDADKGKLTPAQAAAAAAEAALDHQIGEMPKGKKSMLGGLTKAFSRGKQAEGDDPQLPGMGATADGAVPTVDLDEPLDPKAVNRPLEPGSGAPDLNAIMKRVRDDRAKPDKQADSDVAKSDFLMAARRAAQAAAAESAILKRGSEKGGSKRGGSLAEMVKARRKPILMISMAAIIALAGLTVGRNYFSDPEALSVADSGGETTVNEDTAQAPTPTQEETSSTAREATSNAEAATGEPTVIEAPAPTPAPNAAAANAAEDSVDGDDAAPVVTAPEPSTTMQAMAPAASAPTTAAAVPAPTPVPTTTISDIPADAGPAPLREAAAGGDSKALFEIGARYADGRGVKADMKQAAKWYEKAANLGFAPAQYRIGNMYEKGNGVDRDIGKAKTWYQLSANQGNASAMHNLAVLYAMGADGTTDNDSAVRWFTQAADLGVKDSQFNLGILAAKGVGMPQNLEESYKWFALVAKTGDKDSATKRDEIGKSLRPEQLERARASVDNWKPKELNADANNAEIPESWQEASATTASVDMKKAIRNVQAILNKNGYDAGSPDGLMGQRTTDAIKAFQKDNGLEANGVVDKALVDKLLSKK